MSVQFLVHAKSKKTDHAGVEGGKKTRIGGGPGGPRMLPNPHATALSRAAPRGAARARCERCEVPIRVSAPRAAVLLTTELIFASIAGLWLLGERLTLLGVVGAGLILAAVIIAQRQDNETSTG